MDGYKYFRSTVQSTGGYSTKVKERVQASRIEWYEMKLWKNSQVYRMIVRPALVFGLLQIVPQKNYNRHWGIDYEITLYGIWKIKPDYETLTLFLQFSEDPIWFGQVVTKKYGFCKTSHRSLSSKFCHMNVHVCGFHRQIVFTKDRLANIFKLHAYLSNKGCSWQPKSLSDM